MRSFVAGNGLTCLVALTVAAGISARAHAKTVHVGWAEVRSAVRYELELQRPGKKPSMRTVARREWAGELAFGAYRYRLRGLDRFDQPGAWTDAHDLIVAPDVPRLTGPGDDFRARGFQTQAQVRLSWEAEPGAVHYRVTIRDGAGRVALDQTVGAGRLEARLTPGEYFWDVRAVVAGGRHWESAPSTARRLTVEKPSLAEPVLEGPRGRIALARGRALELAWRPVEGAQAYRLRVFRRDSRKDRAPASASSSAPASAASERPIATYRLRESARRLAFNDAGEYRWEVTALRDSPEPLQSIASDSSFELVAKERLGFRPLLFRTGELFEAQGGGGSSYSPQLAWVPEYDFRGGFELRGELAVHALKISYPTASTAPVTSLLAFAGFSPDPLRRLYLELGLGAEALKTATVSPAAALALRYRPRWASASWLDAFCASYARHDLNGASVQQALLGISFDLQRGKE